MIRPPQGRMLAVDALRGYAALSVLVFHLFYNSAQAEVLSESMAASIYALLGFLRSGVAVFFVISGFVIGYTTFDLGNTAQEAGRFALRRQLRLDPPYYAVLALVLVLSLGERLAGFEARSFTAGDVLLNMFYLQGIFHAEPVLSVAWTLCMEVQFYLVLILVLWTAAKLTRGNNRARQSIVRGVVLFSGAVSIGLPFFGVMSTGPWFLGLWWFFALGMCLSWYVRGVVAETFMVTVLTVTGIALAVRTVFGQVDAWAGEWFGIATGLLLYVLIRTGRIDRDPGRVPRYLGRVSYSLYLVHLPLLGLTMGACLKLLGSGPVALAAALIVGTASALVGAELLRRFVEQPSIGWAKRVGARGSSPTKRDLPSSGFQGSHP